MHTAGTIFPLCAYLVLVLMDRTPVCTPTQVEISSVGCVVHPEFGFVRARVSFSQASCTELSCHVYHASTLGTMASNHWPEVAVVVDLAGAPYASIHISILYCSR